MASSSSFQITKMMEVTNRFTPPADIEGYLREQGYCNSELVQLVEVLKEEQDEAGKPKPSCNQMVQNTKFIVTVPARQDPGNDFIDKCINYSRIKSLVFKHMKSSNESERLVVCGTVEDIRAIIAEVNHAKNQADPRFSYTWPDV